MTWTGVLALALTVAATAGIFRLMYGKNSRAAHCIGCGECARTGYCVLLGKPKENTGEKDGACLDKPGK